MDFAHKTVFVTGGTGFIGSHLVHELLKRKARVIVLKRAEDPASFFYGEQLDKLCVVVNGDLKDAKRIQDIITKYHVEYVFHLGAQPIVTTALHHPVETLETNINGTINVLEACRQSKTVKGIVVASSYKAYYTS